MTTQSGGRGERIALGAILMAGLACWIAFRLHTGIVLEDALITFRYARNLAEGHGFVFNPAERVLGTTTPLLTLLLGGLGALAGAGRIPLLANLILMPAGLAAAWLTGACVRRMTGSWRAGLFATGAFCLHPEIVWSSCGGMETPLVLMLMAAGLLAALRGAWTAAAAATALLTLARIDGVVWAAGMFILILVVQRRALARALIVAAGIVSPWLIFSWLYFGALIPHSVIAKRSVGDLPQILSAADLAGFLYWIAPFAGALAPGAAAAGLALYAWGVVRSLAVRVDEPVLAMVALYPAGMAAFLYLGRSPLYFDWYLVPVAWASMLAALVGCRWLLSRVASSRVAGAAALAAVAAFVLLCGRAGVQSARFHRDYQINETSTRRAIGEWLAARTPQDALVAMEAVGYQGYYSGRRVLDLGGLVSPQVVKARRESWSHAAMFHRLLSEQRPDYLVLRSFEVDRNRHFHGGPLFETGEQRAFFVRHYEEARRFEAPLKESWGATSYLTIYRRRPDRG